MAKKKFVWEVYLRPNTLTKDNDRDCIADVHAHVSTQRNEDIADIITKERSEFRKETILSILGLRDKAVKDLIQAGNSFMDGLVQISPRVPQALPEGKATVIVRTKYSAGAIPLKTLREIVYGYPCTAKT